MLRKRTFLIFALKALALLALVLIGGCDRGSRPQLVGQTAPTFAVQDADRRVDLHELRGKVVVLNFWATWCPPCVEEMPSLVAMQKQMRDKVTVLAISTDQDKAAYDRFIREKNIALLTVRDPEYKSSELYGTFRYPETYIIDAQGVLRRKFIGPVDWTKPEIIDYLSKL
ncbi:MAG TPA: TlpA disulfide reductase family protein [Terriglobales bacterium]|nr:TlpA disulfide reductase family protein [Terriglobales bacterium]